jgi:hypothetical protein
VHYLAQHLGVRVEVLERYGRREQTRTDHLGRILALLSFGRATPLDLALLEAWLTQRALEHDQPTLLFRLACEWLQRERILRPRVTTLERFVATARAAAQRETARLLQPLLSEERRALLDGLLVPDEEGSAHETEGIVR